MSDWLLVRKKVKAHGNPIADDANQLQAIF